MSSFAFTTLFLSWSAARQNSLLEIVEIELHLIKGSNINNNFQSTKHQELCIKSYVVGAH